MNETDIANLVINNKELIEQNRRLLKENADQKQEIVQHNLRLEFEKRMSSDLNEQVKTLKIQSKGE
jgi:hypothetical protein